MSKSLGIALIAISLALIGLAFQTVQVVTVTLPKEADRLIATIRVDESHLITLSYRHSVELTRVEGRFRVGSDSVILAVETRMESVGTGLPNAFPERTRTVDGWMVVDEGERPVGPIRFYYVPINQSRLTIANQAIDLSVLKSGALVQIYAEKVHLLVWLGNQVMGGPSEPG